MHFFIVLFPVQGVACDLSGVSHRLLYSCLTFFDILPPTHPHLQQPEFIRLETRGGVHYIG